MDVLVERWVICFIHAVASPRTLAMRFTCKLDILQSLGANLDPGTQLIFALCGNCKLSNFIGDTIEVGKEGKEEEKLSSLQIYLCLGDL